MSYTQWLQFNSVCIYTIFSNTEFSTVDLILFFEKAKPFIPLVELFLAVCIVDTD